MPYAHATLLLVQAALHLFMPQYLGLDIVEDSQTVHCRRGVGILLIAASGLACNSKNASTLKAIGILCIFSIANNLCFALVRGGLVVEKFQCCKLPMLALLAFGYFWASAWAPAPQRDAEASKVARMWSTYFTLSGLAMIFCAKCSLDMMTPEPITGPSLNGHLWFASSFGSIYLGIAAFLCSADTNAAFNKAMTIVFGALMLCTA